MEDVRVNDDRCTQSMRVHDPQVLQKIPSVVVSRDDLSSRLKTGVSREFIARVGEARYYSGTNCQFVDGSEINARRAHPGTDDEVELVESKLRSST
jgi:hypothetical protein